MTAVLVLGGTGWLGSRLVDALLTTGADVTCLARGSSTPPVGARLIPRDRDADDAYDAVLRDWDAIVDLTSNRHHGVSALEALAGHAGHWLTVSTVSVYASNDTAGDNETAALVDGGPVGDYAADKAAIEAAAVERVHDRLTVVRPGLIVGPGDPSDRGGYWPGRFALAGSGPVLAPAAVDGRVQVIDVRDLAEWIARTAVSAPVGVINAVGSSVTLGAVLDEAARIAGFSGRRVDAPAEWLVEQQVQYWAGPRSLPLWLPEGMPGFATRSRDRFVATGGTERPLVEVLQDVLEDERRRGLDRARRSGLTRAEERELLDTYLASAT